MLWGAAEPAALRLRYPFMDMAAGLIFVFVFALVLAIALGAVDFRSMGRAKRVDRDLDGEPDTRDPPV
jgi:hypothetical protein